MVRRAVWRLMALFRSAQQRCEGLFLGVKQTLLLYGRSDANDPTATLVAAHPHGWLLTRNASSVPPLLREKRPMLRPATQVCLLDHGPLNPSWPWR